MDPKSQKYDRQLRLWGERGQQALEDARVCLINASAVGTETLKNLVLPGIGSFTIIDKKKTDGADVGNNFFLERSSIGQPRGKVATELLKEMNEDVSGNFVDEDPSVLIENNSDIFSQFTIVIATELSEKMTLKLGEICWNLGIPLVITKCYGFFGYLRSVVQEHTVVESHPENPIPDLRLDFPLAELQKVEQEINLSTMDSHQASHVPFPILLLKAAKTWKESHNGELPKTSAEKAEFKKSLQSFVGVDNVAEAVSNAHRIWVPTQIPSSVRDILDDSMSKKISLKSSNFWILVKALNEFVNSSEEGNGQLPLQGTLPDMHADTISYTNLQEIYQSKAKSDIAAITARVNNILLEINRAPNSISPEEIKTFCRNSSTLAVVRGRSLDDEYNNPQGFIANKLEDQENNIVLYVLFRAVSHFEEQYKRFPGIHDEEVETDIPLLKKSVIAILSALGINSNPIKDEYIHEMCRFGASELHNIAALMGGVVSQEVIKLITHQFIPANNTFLFNGINSTSCTENL